MRATSNRSSGLLAGHVRMAAAWHAPALAALLLTLLLGSVFPAPAAAAIQQPGHTSIAQPLPTSPYTTSIVQQSVPARYCPDGGTLEGGLCYARCKPGWRGLACSCWKGLESYPRGCGTKPAICHAMSFRRQRLPPVASRAPFSLVLSADPQLFRVGNKFRQAYKALPNNKQLVGAINRVSELAHWPWEAGGGPVLDPRALVVLGDMTEYYREDELDAFRHLYDPGVRGAAGATGSGSSGNSSSAGNSSSTSSDGDALPQQVGLPTWLMFGNHDYVINVNDCAGHYKSTDRNVCARTAVDTMRAVLTPGCDAASWASFPRGNVTSFDAASLAYSFDYGAWHFVVLQYSPRYEESSLSVSASLGWLASELSSATAQQRRIVLLLHSHRELGLVVDPTFGRLVANSNVVAIFYGHVHIKPWGMTGNFPNTNVPMFNCGASWYHVYCYAEFGADTLRVAAVVHNSSTGSTAPQWFGTSVHALLKQQKAKPVLQQFTANPNQTWTNGAGGSGRHRSNGGGRLLLLGLALLAGVGLLL